MHQFDEFFTYTYFPFSDSKSLKKKNQNQNFYGKYFTKCSRVFSAPDFLKFYLGISNNLKASNELHVPILVH